MIGSTLSLRLRWSLPHNTRVTYPLEVSYVGDPKTSSMSDLIRAARQHLAQEIGAHREKLDNLEADLTKLRAHHQLMGQEIEEQWVEIARAGDAVASQAASNAALESLLGAVRGLVSCAIPEQVFQRLTEEASHLGARAAVFDVRGKAAWGAAASGFAPELTERIFRSMVIPLTQDSPFRKVCDAAGHLDTNANSLSRHRKLLDKLKPAPDALIVLFPIRSGGTVSAILYADAGENNDTLPVNALNILSEFAGAQLDRLSGLGGGADAELEDAKADTVTETDTEATDNPATYQEPLTKEPDAVASEEPPVEATPKIESPYPPVEVLPAAEPSAPSINEPPTVHPPVESDPAPVASVLGAEATASPSPEGAQTAEEGADSSPPQAAAATAGSDITPSSDADERLHRDAKRFAKLLVSEIELYNKAKVADGRTNKDLYRRLKSDIERSRQTYEKRFGKTLSKEYDYFHEELLRTLAVSDSSLLGPEYPGPSA